MSIIDTSKRANPNVLLLVPFAIGAAVALTLGV
jgi:hypothetical protein